jgi:hypothetical protein
MARLGDLREQFRKLPGWHLHRCERVLHDPVDFHAREAHNFFKTPRQFAGAGGGRDNSVHDNYYENCDKAQHFDNRGMGWQNYGCNCTGPVSKTSPCNPAAAWAVVQVRAEPEIHRVDP